MSVESLAKIVHLKSPADFIRAVMGRSGKGTIGREDVLGALTNHPDKLGQHMLYYWLYEEGGNEALYEAKRVTIGYALNHSDGIMIDREKLKRMAQAALSQVMKYQDTRKLIAWVNNVTPNAVTKSAQRYRGQINYFIDLHTVFNNSLFKAKLRFLNHFVDDDYE